MVSKCPSLSEQGQLYRNRPKNVEPTHIIYGTEDYYYKIKEKTMRYGKYTLIIVFILIFILFILFLIFEKISITRHKKFINQQDKDSEDTIQLNKINNIKYINGSQLNRVNCELNSTSFWNDNKCSCIDSFSGTLCAVEKFDNTYSSIGTINSNNINFSTITTENTNSLNLCTSLCDTLSDCNGVEWIRKDKSCTLFTSATVVKGKSLFFNSNISSTIYVKDIFSVLYIDRIFIFTNDPLDLYHHTDILLTESNSHITVFLNTVYIVEFFPDTIVNTGNHTGIYSLFSFKEEDFNDLLGIGNTGLMKIIQNEGELPLDWVGLPIWIMYK